LQNKTKIIKNLNWKLFYRIIKWLLPILLILSFYNYFSKNVHFSWAQFQAHLLTLSPLLIASLLFFSFLNWSLESLKWKWTLKPISKLSFKQAFLSVMSGVAVSQVFPNKTGEYIGRLAFVENKYKWIAALLSIWGSVSQLFMTLLFGVWGVVYLNLYQSYQAIVVVSLLLMFFSFVLFANLPFIISKLNWKCLDKLKQSSPYFNRKRLSALLFISMLRYFSFVIPYLLLVYYFSNSNHYFVTIMAAISVIFLLQTIVPSFLFSDIIARISIPVLVFSKLPVPLFSNQLDYLPGLILYGFNLILPALFGVFVLILKKINDK
jgi:hypothetical protein